MEPWEEHPHWKTKAEFFSWLRGQLRKAVWMHWPPKNDFKKEMAVKPPEGYTGKAKKLGSCALSGEMEAISKMQVDHIQGNASLNSWDDVLPFIRHLCASKENMQLVTKEAHKIKSYAEKQGVSYEEAKAIKKAIEACKLPPEEQKKCLLALGFSEESVRTAKQRRACWERYYKGEQ